MTITPTQRILGWITVGLLVFLLAGIVVLKFSVSDLNTDDELINRGQEATNCIGDRADAIDDWRAIFLGLDAQGQEEFLHQVDRLQDRLPIDITRATAIAQQQYNAERTIRLLVQEKRNIRQAQLNLIDSNDPGAEFVCPAIAEELVPPPIEDS